MIYEMLYQSEILKEAAQISVLSLLFLWCGNFADSWQESKFTCKKYEILIVKVGNIKNTAEKSALSQLDCLPGGSSADWWHQFIAISQKEPSGEETAKIKENHTRTKSPPFFRLGSSVPRHFLFQVPNKKISKTVIYVVMT